MLATFPRAPNSAVTACVSGLGDLEVSSSSWVAIACEEGDILLIFLKFLTLEVTLPNMGNDEAEEVGE
jgi:hypothetical protein